MIRPEYANNPRYQQRTRLQTLEDYLQVGVMLWATHHNIQLPLTIAEMVEVCIDLEEFDDWLKGKVDNFEVIEGGKQQ